MELAGLHAFVTGGGRGIGEAVSRSLVVSGAVVTIVGRTEASLRNVVDAGGASAWMLLDVTDDRAIARCVAAAAAERGPIEILVNNAGAVETAAFGRIDRGLWDRMLAANLTSVFSMSQAVLPGMLARRRGRIVNIASTAGLTGYPYVAAYVAAKHGVVGLTRALALEVATSGITVNAVCPGYTETELLRESMQNIVRKTGRSEADVRASIIRNNPQARLVRPDEVAAAVIFLCGPGSDAMTGQAIAVAGGEIM